MTNVGKRVRASWQGEVEGMRNGTIVEEKDGICFIQWDDPRSVLGATFSSRIHGMTERWDEHAAESNSGTS